ncbi:MAG TPA: histidine phosphatase family protein [Nocardioidaceae bacterium]|nr:histidine phosphatase family protein [Nocardioidaceae bacterium]
MRERSPRPSFDVRRTSAGVTVSSVTSSQTPRRLIVMRHAKAEPYAADDHSRSLIARGRAAAQDAGKHLALIEAVPDHAVVSSARRASQTWQAVAKACGSTAEPEFDETVFHGGIEVVLDRLRQVPDEARTVAFVGHNPLAAYLCQLLDDGEGEPAAMRGLLRGFPAGALAVLEVHSSWRELGPETGRVVDFYVGSGG